MTQGASNVARLRAEIDALISDGSLNADPAQDPAIASLDAILVQLAAPKLGNKKSALGWMFGNKPAKAPSGPRGLYLWGGVGRGKSMLMDRFYDLAPTEPKRRVHFHAFMKDIHGRIHKWRQQERSPKEKSADPIPPLAVELAKEANLLCFDEFAVTDVADAMILARLFTGLFEQGVTVVATSNVAPDLLYKDGLNRSFFLPFIELIKTRMEVHELASETDYRMEKLINSDVYMVGDGAEARFKELWHDMTHGLSIAPATIEVAGRKMIYDQTCGGLLNTSFSNLCEKPLGAADYLALADRFHTLFLSNIPVMQLADRNAAKRFIALIDTLYDRGMKLIAHAQARPSKLYEVDHGTEAFEFDRTISRLREMQSDEWLAG